MEPPLSIPVLSDDGFILVGPDDVEISKCFLPNRLVWPEFSNFIEGDDNAS